MKSSKKSVSFDVLKRGALIAALCVVGLGSASVPARAADPVSVAVVDEDKLADGFTKYQNAIKSLAKRSESIGDQLAARALLTPDEAKEFEPLVTKATLAQADNDKIATFVKTSNDRNAEYIALNGKVEKTDADKARIKTLRDLANANSEAVGALSDKLYDNLKKQQQDTDEQFTAQAKSIIVKIAGDRKFTLVVRSRGVIWNIASIDITDDVLKQLNKS